MKYVKVPFTIEGYVVIPIEDDMEIYEAENEVEGNDGIVDCESQRITAVYADEGEIIPEPTKRSDIRRIYNAFGLKGVPA